MRCARRRSPWRPSHARQSGCDQPDRLASRAQHHEEASRRLVLEVYISPGAHAVEGMLGEDKGDASQQPCFDSSFFPCTV